MVVKDFSSHSDTVHHDEHDGSGRNLNRSAPRRLAAVAGARRGGIGAAGRSVTDHHDRVVFMDSVRGMKGK